MTNVEAFAHIIDLANRTTDTATYEYLMREAQEIMRDKNTEDIDYCDFRHLVKERLENQTLKAKSKAANKWRMKASIAIISATNEHSSHVQTHTDW